MEKEKQKVRERERECVLKESLSLSLPFTNSLNLPGESETVNIYIKNM